MSRPRAGTTGRATITAGHHLTIGSIAGIEVRLDRSWVVIALLVAFSFFNRFALIGAVAFFASVLVHELAHALEAQHRGVEVSGITLLLFGGVTEMSDQVDRPREELALTAIGPFSSIVLAAAFGLVAYYAEVVGLAEVAQVAGMLGWINLALGVFNLLPGAPLDGGRILRALVWGATGDRQRAVRIAARAGQLIGTLLAGLGLLQLLLVPGAILGGIWFVVIGSFLAIAAQSEIARQSVGETLGGLTIGELLRRDELVAVPAHADLVAATEQLLVAPERTLVVTREGWPVGVLPFDRVAELDVDDRSGRSVVEVMVPVDALPRVDHRTEITEALRERSAGRPLAVTSSAGGQERIEGVVAPEQLTRIVRRTLQLGDR